MTKEQALRLLEELALCEVEKRLFWAYTLAQKTEAEALNTAVSTAVSVLQ